jgi:hypothetical protein
LETLSANAIEWTRSILCHDSLASKAPDMNWKSGVFRVWLVASACWIAYAASVMYFSVIALHLNDASCAARVKAYSNSWEAAPAEQRPPKSPAVLALDDLFPTLPVAPGGNPFDQFDARAPSNPHLDKVQNDLMQPNYGWFGERLPRCNLFADISLKADQERMGWDVRQYLALAAVPPIGLMILWWIGVWISAGFRRTTR